MKSREFLIRLNSKMIAYFEPQLDMCAAEFTAGGAAKPSDKAKSLASYQS